MVDGPHHIFQPKKVPRNFQGGWGRVIGLEAKCKSTILSKLGAGLSKAFHLFYTMVGRLCVRDKGANVNKWLIGCDSLRFRIRATYSSGVIFVSHTEGVNHFLE